MGVIQFRNIFNAILIVWLLAASFSYHVSLHLVHTLYGWFQQGNSFWTVRKRNTAPSCLTNERIGKHRFANLKGIRLHYVDNGDRRNPLMLFVHGFPEFWYSWKHQLQHFAETHWVVAMDTRGIGESDRPKKLSEYSMDVLVQDLLELVQFLGKEKCVLVAHDWGASISYIFASKYPERIEKLVIMNGGHPQVFKQTLFQSPTLQVWKSWYMFVFQIPYLPERMLRVGNLNEFDRMFTSSDNQCFVDDEEMEAYKYTFSKIECWTAGINYYRCGLWKNGKLNPSNGMKKIEVPTLIIWGDEDMYLSEKMPELTRPFVRDLIINHIPSGNHFIQLHKPQEVNALIEEFINK